MTSPSSLRLALASLHQPRSLDEAVAKVGSTLTQAAAAGADIVCLPESFLPGMRGQELEVPPHDQALQARALEAVCALVRDARVALVLPMDWDFGQGLQNVACFIDADGQTQGFQVKTQIDPDEEGLFVPGTGRRLFHLRGVPFGVVLCHEGWRYPESVRWAAVRGARIVFHPHYAGGDRSGPSPTRYGSPENPVYEKLMVARAAENTVFFASVNYALRYPASATSLISPHGECLGHAEYGLEGLLVREVDLSLATGLLASRLRPERYGDAVTE